MFCDMDRPVIEVEIDESCLSRAEEVLETLPIFKGSHRGLAANQVGVLGEVVVRKELQLRGVEPSPIFSTSHDFEIGSGKRVEIKTKDRTVPPRMDYECSVPLYNHSHQDVDYYVFVSLLRDKSRIDLELNRFQRAFVVGVCNRKMLEELGETRESGETDPRNGTTFWTSCRNIYIRDLVTLDWATNRWKNVIE
jgi:hypothetical protein